MSMIAEQLATALRAAVTALNTAPRFKVPSLDTDSYAVASQVEKALEDIVAKRAPAASDPAPRLADDRLPALMRRAIARFDALGFDDPDGPVDGGDCVELVGELLPSLRAALTANAPRPAPGEAAERKRLTDFLVRDWESSLEQDADSTFGAMEKLLRAGHPGYDLMAIGDLRRDADDAGYGEDLDDEDEDEPEGMTP